MAFALALQLLCGCDVAVAGLLASRSGKSSSSSGAAAPDITYKVFTRNLPSAVPADLDTERNAIIGTGGVPGGAWTLVTTGTGTQNFDITGLAGGPFNAVLIQAPEAEDYRIDSIELVDANGITIDSAAAATIRSDEVVNDVEAAGTPDGKTANTDSLPAAKAFLFARFTTSVTLFRVTLAGTTRSPGDVEFAFTLPRGVNQLSGGVAVAPSGQIMLPFADEGTRNIILARLEADGGSVTTTAVELDTNVTGGLPCALVDAPRDRVYVSFMRAPVPTSEENLRVVRYSLATPGAPTTATELAVLGIERVEANALALDPIGEMMVAGGRPATLGGLTHWLRKVNIADTEVWVTPTPATGTGNYFHGVATDGSGNVFAVGDNNSAAGDWQIQRFNSAGTPAPASAVTEGDTGADRAVTAAVGGASLYVGGYFTRAGEGRNGLIFKYNASDLTDDAGGGFPLEINGFDDANDEVTDIAFDGGELFVVGFTTVNTPAQGQNWFVRKYSTAGALVWERTYHHGFGNDRAITVAISGTHIVVAGEVTITGGTTTDLHVRKYVR
ncbi:MAG TPA: hypothetical protein VF950_21760 [Planctomycetota bacterium]